MEGKGKNGNVACLTCDFVRSRFLDFGDLQSNDSHLVLFVVQWTDVRSLLQSPCPSPSLKLCALLFLEFEFALCDTPTHSFFPYCTMILGMIFMLPLLTRSHFTSLAFNCFTAISLQTGVARGFSAGPPAARMVVPQERIDQVRQIMVEFAEETGLTTKKNPPRRYLWTDAHAVCNFLSLYKVTGDETFKDLAVRLIEQVHHVLGKHRDDDARSGWISGLNEEEGELHPTKGGLRIGKKLNERGPNDFQDRSLEWDQDGQYLHYVTKWMHALCRASAVTGDERYGQWAAELAQAAHHGFSHNVGGHQRYYWKMSIDLSRPLVTSSGHHDPLDAYITYNEIEFGMKKNILQSEIEEVKGMLRGAHWDTDDSLGIGGLLCDAGRVTQLTVAKHLKDDGFAASLMQSARRSLATQSRRSMMEEPADYRLAFRELGMSIGLHSVPLMNDILQTTQMKGSALVDANQLQPFVALGKEIEDFWLMPAHQRGRRWKEHLDINRVMLATSLLPDEFLAV